MTEDGKIRILVVPSDRSGGVMYMRSTTPHQYLQEHYGDKFVCDIIYMTDFPKDNLEAFFQQYDLVQIHKQLDRGCQLINMLKFLDIPFVVDVDDNFKLGPDHPMYMSAKRENWAGIVINHLKEATCVTTTTPIFANLIKKYNNNVEVLPNAIDENNTQFSTKKTPSDKVRFGIVCGSTHMKDLELMQKINCLPQETKDQMTITLSGFDTRGVTTIYKPDGTVERRNIKPQESIWVKYESFLTDNYKEIKDPNYVNFLKQYMNGIDTPDMFKGGFYERYWTRDIHHYGTHYEHVDVLLAPLKVNDFNEVKSQLKFVEAGFCGCAVIASNFGPYTIDSRPYLGYGGKVDPTGNCLLVDERKNHKDWVKYISYLVSHRDAIGIMAENLRNDMLRDYSLAAVTKKRAELYEKIVKEHREKQGLSV